MKDFAIFYRTCDEYSDLWEHFCYFLKKYWPEYNGRIYVNGENKEFSYPGLNVINLNVGTCMFSDRIIKGLKQVEETNILLMMDDLFLMGKVDVDAVNEYYQYFIEADLDSLVFRKFPSFIKTVPVKCRNAEIVIPPSVDMYSAQLAFWKKDVFMSFLNPVDGPWEMEWFGAMRANLSHLKLACTDENVIPSIPGGGLHIGKWDPVMIEFLQKEKYDKIDFSKRGIYTDLNKFSFKKRLRFQWRNYFSPSRLDVIKLIWKNRHFYWTR